jgi:hypothetical protein
MPEDPGPVHPGMAAGAERDQPGVVAGLAVIHVIRRSRGHPQRFRFIDDDALKTLVHKCRENAPDATDAEIAELGAMMARRIVRMQNVSNHAGLLITQTAKCFLGEPFAMYRREKLENERRYAAMMQEDQGREDQ